MPVSKLGVGFAKKYRNKMLDLSLDSTNPEMLVPSRIRLLSVYNVDEQQKLKMISKLSKLADHPRGTLSRQSMDKPLPKKKVKRMRIVSGDTVVARAETTVKTEAENTRKFDLAELNLQELKGNIVQPLKTNE